MKNLKTKLLRLGWSQAELSRKTGIRVDLIGQIINSNKPPTIDQADAIQIAIAVAGEYLDVLSEWPETFSGLRYFCKRKKTDKVKLETLIGNREAMMLPYPETEDTTSLDSTLDSLISELTKNEQKVIKYKFWNGLTLRQAAKNMNITAGRVFEIKNSALRRLKNPHKIKKLIQTLR